YCEIQRNPFCQPREQSPFCFPPLKGCAPFLGPSLKGRCKETPVNFVLLRSLLFLTMSFYIPCLVLASAFGVPFAVLAK
ncbi:hypothetical protein, partial [Skermanella aerolata]|uniref:hypothetical protein n=1 Tax=Skermanella aerolata TaxID=393310 RepID=UPI001B3B6806